VRIRRRLEGKLCSCLAKFSEAVEKRKEAVRHNDDDTTILLLNCLSYGVKIFLRRVTPTTLSLLELNRSN
jgi:hypothetical protein